MSIMDAITTAVVSVFLMVSWMFLLVSIFATEKQQLVILGIFTVALAAFLYQVTNL